MKGNMRKKKTILKRSILTLIAVVCVVLLVVARQAGDVTGTAWALMPPIVAITLALLTKEVYSSLFAGIVVGGVLFSGCSFEGTVTHVLEDGFLSVLSDPGNVGILIFLILLGTIVALMNNAGGSAAFGEWAKSHIKTKVGRFRVPVESFIVVLLHAVAVFAEIAKVTHCPGITLVGALFKVGNRGGIDLLRGSAVIYAVPVKVGSCFSAGAERERQRDE